ncbi:MAG TPA: DUF1501 domain-containing protein [Planctomycetaceae bacterium]|jgi:hypothetical protein|nr:DUF1501 domain-containing protein [Pirellulales bacterium]HCK71211.1 DUF1501 domain-containing protein [Planctomycetaceae bacterium]
MLRMLGSERRNCDGISRRETLQAGGLATLGSLFGMPSSMLNASVNTDSGGKAKSVIVLYLLGGAPTQDMWDMKPDAPGGVGGEFKPVASNVPGMDVCELLPNHTNWMDKCAVVRTVNHKAGCHNPMPSLTGYPEPLPSIGVVQDNLPPSMGSVCEYMNQESDFPAYVHMPCMLGWGQHIRRAGPYAGFLGRQYDPLFTECYPTSEKPSPDTYQPQIVHGEPKLPVAKLPKGVTLDRLKARRRLTDQFDDALRDLERGGEFERAQKGALALLTSNEIREAFDLEKVAKAKRELYGDTLFGNSALIGRNLVEKGTKFVNVTWDAFWTRPAKLDGAIWDTHSRNFGILKEVLLPVYDHTFNGLMTDLSESGLLDETLVVVMSDMGRTPKINKNAGRDHWTFCYSVLFAGAGIQGGTLYGKSDSQAAYVKDKPVSPADICATIYKCLGIDPEMQIPDSNGQPVKVALDGRPIEEILA